MLLLPLPLPQVHLPLLPLLQLLPLLLLLILSLLKTNLIRTGKIVAEIACKGVAECTFGGSC